VTAPVERDPLLEFPSERLTVFASVEDRIETGPPVDQTTKTVRTRPATVDQSRWWLFVSASLLGAILVYWISYVLAVMLPRLNSTSAPISAGARQAVVLEPLRITAPVRPALAHPQPTRVVPTRTPTSILSSQAKRPLERVAPAERVQFRGSLAIASTPPAAQVFVNGQRMGVTPLELQEVPVGSRAMRVEADGYAAWSSLVRVIAGRRTDVTITLVPIQSDSGP
jgi:hypothetical protein